MKKVYLLMLILVSAFCTEASTSDSSYYRIFLVQDADSFEIKAGEKTTLTIHPTSFQFVFMMVRMREITVNATHDNYFYKTPAKSPFKKCEYIGPGTGAMANDYNKSKELFIHDFSDYPGFCYLFYDSAGDHRFDLPVKKNGDTLVLTYTVNKFWNVAENQPFYFSKEMDDLFITFFRNELEPCPAIEKSTLVPDRRYLHLIFKK